MALVIVVTLCAYLQCATAASQAPILTSDTQVATAGFFTLSWHGGRGASFELQKSTTPDFKEATSIYRGADTARTESGQINGRYYYRARTMKPRSERSKPVLVTVRHHPLSRALGFFGAGLVVFLATTAVIIGGARRTRVE